MANSSRARFTISGLLLSISVISVGCGNSAENTPDFAAYSGTFISGTEDTLDGRSNKLYWLETDSHKKYALLMHGARQKGAPLLEPWDKVVVYGSREGDVIRVDSYERVQSAAALFESAERRIIDPPSLSPPQKVLWLSCCSTYDLAKGQELQMKGARGINQYFANSSFGIWTQDITVAGNYSCSTPESAESEAEKAGIKVKDFDQVQALIKCSGGGGFGLDGHTPLRTGMPRGKFNRYSNVGNDSCGLIQQEIGHNYGLAHSHFCPGAGTPSKSCASFDEYGDQFTAMASGCGRFSAWEVLQMNWFGGCNVLNVEGNGTFDIGPLGLPCNGPQVLMFKADKGSDAQHYYYVEYRKPGLGADTTNGILVHYSSDPKVGGWKGCDYPEPECPNSWLVDVTGEKSAKKALLAANGEWKSPENVTIKVKSLGDVATIELAFENGGTNKPVCYSTGTPYDDSKPVCKSGTGGGSGTGGTAGSGGTTGTGGKGGMGGSGASTSGGKAGSSSGGAAGTGGSGETGGSGTTGGSTATGGKSTGGSSGTGNTAGKPGVGGTGTGGAGGGSAGTGGGMADSSADCGCSIPTSGNSNWAAGVLAALAVLSARRRWRRRA